MKFKSKFLSIMAKTSILLVPFLAFQSGKISSDVSSLANSNQATYNTANAVSVSTYAELKSAISGDAEEIVFANDIICSGSISGSAITIPSGKTKKIDGKDFVFSAKVTGANEQGILNKNPSAYNLITNNGTLNVSNLTIRGGGRSAIVNSKNAKLTINSCTIERSSYYDPDDTEQKCCGGGLYNYGNALVKNSKFSRNNANFGGGFVNYRVPGEDYCGFLIMDSCSLNENRSLVKSCGGGGGENRGNLIMNNCTIANNTSTELGGALNCFCGGFSAIVNSTIVGNITTRDSYFGGGIGIHGSDIIFANSIASNNYYFNSAGTGSKVLTDFGLHTAARSSELNVYNGAYNHAKDPNGEVASSKFNTHINAKQISDDGNFYATYVEQSILNADGTSLTPESGGQPALFKRPIIVKSEKGTYIAPIKNGSPFCSGGTNIYLNIPSNIGSWKPSNIGFGYGTDSSITAFSSFKTPAASDKVTVYQDGTTRDSIVMGAARPTDIEYRTITVVPGAHGSVTGASIYGDTYPKGTPISLFAIPDEGYTLKEWKNVETGATYPPSTFTNYPLNESLVIQPVFTDEGFHIITNLAPEADRVQNKGYLKVNPSALVGDQVAIESVPNKNCALTSLRAYTAEGDLEIKGGKFTMPDADVIVDATFREYMGITNNTPEADKDINNGYIQVISSAVEGTKVTITVCPNEDYTLDTLVVYKTGDESITIPVTDNKFTMPDYPVTVSATFKIIRYDITNTAPESDKDINNGYVVVDSTAVRDDEVSMEIHPNEGYELETLKVFKTGDESTIVPVTDNKFTMPEYPVTVSASFKLIIFDITNNSPASAKDDNHGYIEVDSSAIPNAVVTIVSHPSDSYTLDTLTVFKTGDESVTIRINDGKFTMPNFHVTVKATFSSVPPIPPPPVPPTDPTCFYHAISLSLISIGAIFYLSIFLFGREDRYVKYLVASTSNSFALALAVTGVAIFNCTFCIGLTVASSVLLGFNALAVAFKFIKGKKKK